jgi:site-specific DNA-methyltransferase (adenine-specific)
MIVEKVGYGYAICADSTMPGTVLQVRQLTGDLPLIIADPPYGNVLPAKWDQYKSSAENFATWMLAWTHQWSLMLLPNAAFYVWGGIGGPGFRPFYRYIVEVEENTNLLMANMITWSKRRAYGVKWNYLFTREELAYFINGRDIKKPRCFNIPLLETKRGYAGYNAKYPAKSEFYRRTNVWSDITEIMQGKVHDAQKKQRVMEIPIEVHTHPGEFVVDPFAGSGTTAFAARKLGRRFVVIENDPKTFEEMLHRLRTSHELEGGGEVTNVQRPSDDVVSSHGQEEQRAAGSVEGRIDDSSGDLGSAG